MIQNVKKFPKNSGVYFFRDKNRRVLYIGKAANLKNRLNSYFNKNLDNPRLQKMLETAKGVDWQETGSEIEALILESQLIKKCRPPFNIMLRDDKQYFYVGFTNEQFPKILISHQPTTIYRNIEVEIWIGPFTDGDALKTVLRLLRRIFPYCTCKQKHNNYCLNYHIGNCPGFCCLKKEASAKEINSYKKNVVAIKEMLNGRKTSLIKKIGKDMAAAAKKKDFERAIGLRDQLEKIKSVFENSKIIHELELKNKESARGLDALKKMLNLSTLPRRIEGYDVSNIQGEFATGAMSVFIDGQPDKNKYRKFKIRIASKPNDVAMLKEVLTRRFNHPEWRYPDLILIDGGKGQLSAAKAVISNDKFQMTNKIPIITLTKNEKHVGDHILSTTRKTAIKIKKLPPAVRNLILQIDAEAHRFAIGYYRKLHEKIFK
jgi:excinuclease ABC subunit C